MDKKSQLLDYVNTKIFPAPASFEELKNKYKKQIDAFYFDLKNNLIPYTKYIKEYENAISVADKIIKDKFNSFDHLIIIGIGGIINGTKAIYNILSNNIKKEIIFVDNIGFKQFEYIQNHLKNHLQPNKDILILVSKSGGTLETLLESSFFLYQFSDFLKSKRIIVVTSEKNKPLDNFATTSGLDVYYLPADLGGRFSHFYSSLLPLLLCRSRIDKIFNASKQFLDRVENDFYKSKFLHFVLNLYYEITRTNITNLIILNYIDNLNSLSDFLVQLWDESLGKLNKKGFRFPACMINALCPKEQHSQLQAFLEGKRYKLFFFFVPQNDFDSIEFHDTIFFNRKFKISEVLNAQSKAVASSFIKENLPLYWFEVKELNENFIGEFLTFFTLCIILVGYLDELNPYTQEAVELYKHLTKIFLKLEWDKEEVDLFKTLQEF